MQFVEQVASLVPYGETVLHKAEGVYGYSKDKTIQVYNQTKGKIVRTKDGYIELRKNVEKLIFKAVQETVNQCLSKTEHFVGVQGEKKNPEELKYALERIQIIAYTIFREYIMKSKLITNKNVQALLAKGKKFTIDYLVPLYISIKATLIVTWEMLIQFLETQLKDIKMSYQSSKDHIIMYISGNFKEENLKQKVFEGIKLFKNFTVKIVNKGMEIKVDRESLMQNYDKFAVHLLELIKEVRQKGEGNLGSIKKKSRDLYKEVVNRVRTKELELKTQMRSSCPQLSLKQE